MTTSRPCRIRAAMLCKLCLKLVQLPTLAACRRRPAPRSTQGRQSLTARGRMECRQKRQKSGIMLCRHKTAIRRRLFLRRRLWYGSRWTQCNSACTTCAKETCHAIGHTTRWRGVLCLRTGPLRNTRRLKERGGARSHRRGAMSGVVRRSNEVCSCLRRRACA